MASLPDARKFAAAVQSVRGEEPLLIGLIGPPGGGKTVSALRLAAGMKRVRPGPVVLIDTEGGRSKKYSPSAGEAPNLAVLKFDFLRVDMTPPFRPHDFLAAIQAQLPLKPAAVIVDVLSDEHEGEGGFLEWHDAIANAKKGEPGYIGGNEWAAWGPPKAARKRLISGLLQIKAPLLFTFRAREKTQEATVDGKKKIINIGWVPVAPLEIVHTLDLTCLLPPRANGVPVWTSDKLGEDFVIKLPAFLAPLIQKGALSEDTGEALARWALGDSAPSNFEQAVKKTGSNSGAVAPSSEGKKQEAVDPRKPAALESIRRQLATIASKLDRASAIQRHFLVEGWTAVNKLEADNLLAGLASLSAELNGLASMQAEREPEQAGLLTEQEPARVPGED